ncbi:TetR family transcriptional regulator [Saccharopolyspora sp. NPDC050642]|uniref:TetR/AcrR family transcriptional regulator n=1 Tax=Saccharopolyspora sp. NPDC050642 TaxID=3157099 RepID=UPI0034066CDF
MASAESGGARPARRPRDRKEQIVLAAATLFREKGFHNVALADVAGAVGITAGALYRHFRGKEELLLHAVLNGIETTDAMVRSSAGIEDLIQRAGRAAIERRGLAALWQREARHLDDDNRADLRKRTRATADRLVDLVAADRPDLAHPDQEVIAYALLAVFVSFGMHRITVSKREFERIHRTVSLTIARCAFPTEIPPVLPARPAEQGAGVGLPRRELLLAEATRLFDERGFQSVNMADIGAAAGIAGSTVYKHFPSKNDLLSAALMRGSERMHGGMARALADGSTPRETLDLLLRSHIDFALEHSRLIGILVSEREELPDKERLASYRAQRDYFAVWAKLLTEVQPNLSAPVTKMIIDTVFAVVNSLARIRRLAERPELRSRLIDLTSALLYLPVTVD